MLFKAICDRCGQPAAVVQLNGQIDQPAHLETAPKNRKPKAHDYQIDCPKCGLRVQPAKLQTRPRV